MEVNLIVGFLGAIIGAVIVAISTQAVTQRRIQMENVTKERAKWRDRIRRHTSEVHKVLMMSGDSHFKRQKLYRLKNIFRVLLNPGDCEDRKILKLIDPDCECDPEFAELRNLACGRSCKERAEQFGELISYLLKHDWERAKEEIKHPLFQWREPKRQKPDSISNCSLLKRSCQKTVEFIFCQEILEFRKLIRIILFLTIIPVILAFYILFIDVVFDYFLADTCLGIST